MIWAALVWPVLLVWIAMYVTRRVNLNMADEGYLVWGTQNLQRGLLPIRDFRAYDPGRYYWCALFNPKSCAGFGSVRLAMATAALLSVSIIGATLYVAGGNLWLSSAGSLLVVIWLRPRHKQLEYLFTLLTIGLLFACLILQNAWIWGGLGLAVGVAGFFGLNLFIYMAGSSVVLAVLWALSGNTLNMNAIAPWFIGGVAIGLVPTLWLVEAAPGYGRAYLDRKVIAVLRRGSANLKKPLPWLWAGAAGSPNPAPLSIRLVFTTMPIFLLVVPMWFLLSQTGNPDPLLRLALAASSVGLVNLHHTFSRADLEHMIQPILAICVVLPCVFAALFGFVAAASLTFVFALVSAIYRWHPVEAPLGYLVKRHALVPFETARETMLLPAPLADKLEWVRRLIESHTATNDPILAVPNLVSLHALFDRQPSVYDVFPVYPSSAADRARFMQELRASAPKLVFVNIVEIDGRADLMVLNNYPNLADEIAVNYWQCGESGTLKAFALRGQPETEIAG